MDEGFNLYSLLCLNKLNQKVRALNLWCNTILNLNNHLLKLL